MRGCFVESRPPRERVQHSRVSVNIYVPAKNEHLLVRDEDPEISRAAEFCPLSPSCLVFFLQVVCEFPLIQAAFQRLQGHRGAGGDAAKCPAQKARSPGHDYHQHTGGEPRRRRRHGLGAEVGGEGPRTEAQGGPKVL